MSAVPKNLRVFAGMLEGVQEAIASLDAIESMERLEGEHAARIDAAKAEIDALKADAASQADAINAARTDASRILADAEDKAAEIVESAGRDAKRIRDEATAELHQAKGVALQLVADAKAKAEGEEARAAAAVARSEAAEAKLAEIQAAIARITGG